MTKFKEMPKMVICPPLGRLPRQKRENYNVLDVELLSPC